LLLYLGYYFGENIEWLAGVFTRLDSLLKMGAVLGGVVVLGYFLWKRKKSSKGR
jgi:membrane protein DedA with SNARE-associated domain